VQARTLEVFDDFGLAERALALGRKAEAFNVVGAGGGRTPPGPRRSRSRTSPCAMQWRRCASSSSR